MAAKKNPAIQLHASDWAKDPSRRCEQCLRAMPRGKFAQRCDDCEQRSWPSVPQFTIEGADPDELAKRCDRDEAEAWLEMERLLERELALENARARELESAELRRNASRRELEEKIADILAEGLEPRKTAELQELRLRELRRQLNGESK